MNDYNKMPEPTRERLENEFRNLLLVIPFARRIELEKIVREECFTILQEKLAKFDEHWTLAPVSSVDSQISGWKDYIDPITGEVNESERF